MDVLAIEVFAYFGRTLADCAIKGRVAASADTADSRLDPFAVGSTLRRNQGLHIVVVNNHGEEILRAEATQGGDRRFTCFGNLVAGHRARTIEDQSQVNWGAGDFNRNDRDIEIHLDDCLL